LAEKGKYAQPMLRLKVLKIFFINIFRLYEPTSGLFNFFSCPHHGLCLSKSTTPNFVPLALPRCASLNGHARLFGLAAWSPSSLRGARLGPIFPKDSWLPLGTHLCQNTSFLSPSPDPAQNRCPLLYASQGHSYYWNLRVLVSHRPARIPNSQDAHPLMLHDHLLVIPGCSQLLKP